MSILIDETTQVMPGLHRLPCEKLVLIGYHRIEGSDARFVEVAMTRIAFEIDDKVLALVERYAKSLNTSVEKIVAEYLEGLARGNDPERQRKARQELLRLMEEKPLDLGDWKWNREELYDRAVFSRYQRPGVRGGEEAE